MATQNHDRFEILARELATGKTVEQAMLAAGYAPETTRQGRVARWPLGVAEQPSRGSGAAGRVEPCWRAGHKSGLAHAAIRSN